MLFTMQVIYFMKLVQCNVYLVSTVDTAAPLGSQLFVG